MSVNLWRLIFETASEEEIKHVLHEAGVSIPGFRPDKIRTVHRSLIIKTMVQAKNGKKIRGVYQKLLDTNFNQHFKIENTLRKKIIQLILTGDPTSTREAEDLGEQLTLLVENHLEDSTKNSSEQNVVQDWQGKYKILEKQTKKNLQSLEKKCEKKVKETIEMEKRIVILEKKHEGEISRLQGIISKVTRERNLYQKRIEEWQDTTRTLENEIKRKEGEIQDFARIVESNKEKIDKYCEKMECQLAKNSSIDEYVSYDTHEQEDIEYIDCTDNKIKILVIGETFYKQENLKNFDLEFINAQKINAEELEKRSDLATIVIMLSWTMTMAMQRKIRKSIPIEKLNEFYDYSTFRDYIKEEERISYATN